jgi:hypothetical protein
MDGLLWVTLGLFGGGIALVAALLTLLNPKNGIRELLMRLLVAASFFSLVGAVRYGGHLYLLDQEEAKAFIDRRIAEIRAGGPNTPFPPTQNGFVGENQLPRLLRGQTFYFHDGGDQFHIEVRVDWDGGWGYHSQNEHWRRST